MSEPGAFRDADRFRAAILRYVGLQFEDMKLPFLEDVLTRRVSALNTSVDLYLRALEGEPTDAEIRALAESLTINETYFFRNAEQFEALAHVALPDRIEARASSKSLRVLSAGCASGEEPYSIAIVVQEVVPRPTWDVSIRGVDLSPAALQRAQRARYTAWSLRQTSSDIQRRWFDVEGQNFLLKEPIKSVVRFEQRNLVADDPELWLPASYDIVFCRNVTMYFSQAHAAEVMRRIAYSLASGGFLFLGHAETLRGLSDDFHLCNSHGTFYYRRKDARSRWSVLQPFKSQNCMPLRHSGPAPSMASSSDAWVDTIRAASARVEALAGASNTAKVPMQSQSAKDWNVAHILAAVTSEDFTDAIAGMNKLPPEADEDPDVLLLRATVQLHGGDTPLAEETCRRLLDLDELNAGAHFVLGLCREGAGDRSDAAQHYKTAVYLDPDFAMPHLRLGFLARTVGDRVDARRELGRARTLLGREDASRLLLFGGGFNRAALIDLCDRALRESGNPP